MEGLLAPQQSFDNSENKAMEIKDKVLVHG